MSTEGGRPPRRLRRAQAWLSRGKLWDDVFTRMVATLLSALIIGLFAAAAGLITWDRRAWAALYVVAIVLIGLALIVWAMRGVDFDAAEWLYAILLVGALVILLSIVGWYFIATGHPPPN